MNISKIKGAMAEHNVSQSKLAENLDISCNSMSRKMCGKSEFKAGEIKKISEILDISPLLFIED